MQTKTFFRLSPLFVILDILVVLALVIIYSPTEPVKAKPLLEKPTYYVESLDVLQDGSIIVRRNRGMPEQSKSAELNAVSTPVLLEPSDGALLSTLIPDYVWEEVSSDVTNYTFQLSRSSDFSTVDEEICDTDSNPSPGSLLYISETSNLLPDTIYYWHVASGCIAIPPEDYSAAFSFRTAPSGGVILPAPILLAPTDAKTTGSTRVTFSLGPVNGAVKYQYRFYDNQAAGWDDWSLWVLSPSPLKQLTFNPQETTYWRGAASNSYAVGTPSVMASFTTPPVTASTVIDPIAGGTLTPDPGNISIQFPPGAVTLPTTLSYTLQPVPNYDLANFQFAGRAFTLTASDTNGNVTTFNQPFTLTITYDSWDLIAAGIDDPSRLNLAFWNGSIWQEILPCAGCSIDTNNQTVTVVINHLTEFALVGPIETKVYLPLILR